MAAGQPGAGRTFPVPLFNPRTADFSSMQGLDIGNGKYFMPIYHPTDLTLLVVYRALVPLLMRQ